MQQTDLLISLVDRLPQFAAADRELQLLGAAFDARILIGMGGQSRLLTVRAGRVVSSNATPGFDAVWDFALRGPVTMWDKFTSDPPPPMYNDIWAMRMRVPEFIFEGNTLIAAQNARALTRLIYLLRAARAHA